MRSPQTLCLTGSAYTLNVVDNMTYAANGLSSMTGDITIVGNGASIIESGSGYTLESTTLVPSAAPPEKLLLHRTGAEPEMFEPTDNQNVNNAPSLSQPPATSFSIVANSAQRLIFTASL